MSIRDSAEGALDKIKEIASDAAQSKPAQKAKAAGSKAKDQGCKAAAVVGDTVGVLAFALVMKPGAKIKAWWSRQKEDFDLYKGDGDK